MSNPPSPVEATTAPPPASLNEIDRMMAQVRYSQLRFAIQETER